MKKILLENILKVQSCLYNQTEILKIVLQNYKLNLNKIIIKIMIILNKFKSNLFTKIKTDVTLILIQNLIEFNI